MKERGRDGLVVAGATLAILLITTGLRALQSYPNPTIAALLLLLVVLAAATSARLRVAIGTSVAAVLAFNFFLLPPFHTFIIADAQNWVALFVFLAVASIASQLSAAARHRTREADARRQEVTRLFDLSRDILLTTDSTTALADVARYVARRFELTGVAICLPEPAGWVILQGGARLIEPSPAQLQAAFAMLRGPLDDDPRHRAHRDHAEVPGALGVPVSLVPLRLGTRPVGLLATDAPGLEAGTLDALGGVVAIAIERAHFLDERKKAESLSGRAELASALLASFSHDLRTPVTSVRVAVENLQNLTLSPEDRLAQSRVALEELDRLTRLFENILDMGRIDAAAINPAREWVSPGDLVDAAIAYVGPMLTNRPLEIDVDGSSEIHLDPRLTSSALAHLLENALRYSPADRPIVVRAWIESDGAHLTVRDHGPGLDPADLDRVFEPFYRSPKVPRASGTGLGLAITRGLLAAEGGRVWCENAAETGASFTIVVPADVRTIKAEAS